ncbi:hypothetical protein GF391_04285 [Candidatus Uhrbacteria bacterium]|nr:hypothetical protein [Candidatus Uhrbacteria bacterium]
MNEKMLVPQPDKKPESKMAPEYLLAMINGKPQAEDKNIPPTESQSGLEEMSEEKDTPTGFEHDPKKDWAWGKELSSWRRKQLEKNMPPLEEEAADPSETRQDLPRFDIDDPDRPSEEYKEVRSSELIDTPVSETLRSADDEAVSGIREKIASDFSARGTAVMSPEVSVSESYEMKETPDGFVTKEVPSYEISAIGKLPTTAVSTPPEMPSELEPEERGTLKAA